MTCAAAAIIVLLIVLLMSCKGVAQNYCPENDSCLGAIEVPICLVKSPSAYSLLSLVYALP